MVVIAVTGGIGSGKSTVASLLARHGAAVIDLDEIARQIADPGGSAYQPLVDHFGPGVVRADGSLDRAAVASRAFSDPAELAALNAITHPAIAAVTAARLAEAEATVAARGLPVVLDIPLLTAATKSWYGLAGVVVVDTPVEIAVRRLVEHRGMTASDAEARIRAQASREERRRWADVVVDNSGSPADLASSVNGVWEWLQGLIAESRLGSVDRPAQKAADADRAEDHQEDQ
jgi:dephospho-CoA kinase